MKSFKFFLIFLFLKFSTSKNLNLKFKNLKCEVSEHGLSEFVYENFSCFAKTWKRKLTTLTADIFFKIPINEVYVSRKFPAKIKT